MTLSDTILLEIERRAKAAHPGPWTVGPYALDIIGPGKFGEAKLFDVRGWGFYTGKGSGALGLSEKDGKARQEANAAHVVGLDPPTALALVAAVRERDAEIGRLEQRVRELSEGLEPFAKQGKIWLTARTLGNQRVKYIGYTVDELRRAARLLASTTGERVSSDNPQTGD